ncbi:CaiB/BaiF CoA-transferase family protein [Pseudonocardia xishanensis]|uniref:Crotonobetainyl-CoA:carnitine CoA-transferase CaiB-like acyl-CoA transferase n=1 Tax=Pseudonocardia xishanensis TaxID=630995 RepID=A0ABP8S0Z0_9PSEU
MAELLDGIRVVDLGGRLAGRLATTLLADQGADVIHVDRPGTVDVPADAFLLRARRRVTLDLTDPTERAVARRLAVRADVVVQNLRPDVPARFGLGYEDLREEAPHLVYLSLPGFPADDPRHAVPGWECVVDAATANCRIRAGEAPAGWDPERPTYSAVPVASNFAAFLGATGVAAALVERCRSGRGQHVSVPLSDAVFEAVGDAGGYPSARGVPTQKALRANGSGTYRSADGRYVQFNPIGASRRFLSWLLDAAGHPEWAASSDRWTGAEGEAALRALLGDLFATRTAAEWEELGARAGVPLAVVRTSREWLRTPHSHSSGSIVSMVDPVFGPTLMPGTAVEVVGAGERPARPRPRRPRDADRRAVLAESAADPRPPEPPGRAGERRRPLAGLTVLDLTQVLAGPTSARLLGELGASVVKINAPHRGVYAHGVVNRGKDSILLDVEREPGRRVFWALAEQADVVVANFTPGTAERYGIGPAHVLARCPGIVHVSVSCYGATGPWARGRGYETQAQAATGLMARAGGAGPPTVLGPYNLLDYGTGVLAAYAAVLGVLHRERTGAGCALATSLVRTAGHHQAAFLVDGAGVPSSTEPAGPTALGEHPLHGFHRTADGWLALGAAPEDLPRLAGVPGLAELAAFEGAEPDQEKLAAVLGELFLRRRADDWVPDLRAAGVGAHRVLGLSEVMADPAARARGRVVTQTSEEVGEVTLPGVTIGLSDTPLRTGAPARRPGADAERVLAAVGLADSLTDLERAWVVQTRDLPPAWPPV